MISEIDSTVPAMSTLSGQLWYRQSKTANISRQSGESSYIRISCPMIPCSLATVASVNQGWETKSSSTSSDSSRWSVAPKT